MQIPLAEMISSWVVFDRIKGNSDKDALLDIYFFYLKKNNFKKLLTYYEAIQKICQMWSY